MGANEDEQESATANGSQRQRTEANDSERKPTMVNRKQGAQIETHEIELPPVNAVPPAPNR
jgi:hypothetical protein